MALINDPRHTLRDRDVWQRMVMYDRILADSPALTRQIDAATAIIRRFFQTDPRGYIGVSWGKDSVVMADMAMRVNPHLPLVWIRERPHANPDNERVRDEFIKRWPCAQYHEIDVLLVADEISWHASGTLEGGFAQAVAMFGDRHVSGVRAEESGVRKLTMMRNGTDTTRTARPIGWWTSADVFAYLHRYDLPVHPAYAMSMNGTIPRDKLRVCSIGGENGTGFNRRQWEQVYYRNHIEQITREWEAITGLSAGDKYVI